MSGPLDSVRLLRPLAPEAGKLDPKVIRQAADWWARLRDGATPTERDRFERWRQAVSYTHLTLPTSDLV